MIYSHKLYSRGVGQRGKQEHNKVYIYLVYIHFWKEFKKSKWNVILFSVGRTVVAKHTFGHSSHTF